MWRYVKFPVLAALLAFALPFLSVSLAGERLFGAAGWELATGRGQASVGGSAVRLSDAGTNPYFAAAIGLSLLTLLLSLLRRRFAWGAVGSAVLAMAVMWAGSNQYGASRIAAAATKLSGTLGSLAAPMIRVDWQIGYWLAMAALGVAAVLAFLAVRDDETPSA